MKDKSKLTKLLHLVTATIESLDEDQIDQLASGKAKLTFASIARASEPSGVLPADYVEIREQLNQCKDREGARFVLSAMATRDALAAFARTLKVHVVKHDRREDIEAKIIEFVIGGKLRTEAIRSLNLKGSAARSTGQ